MYGLNLLEESAIQKSSTIRTHINSNIREGSLKMAYNMQKNLHNWTGY